MLYRQQDLLNFFYNQQLLIEMIIDKIIHIMYVGNLFRDWHSYNSKNQESGSMYRTNIGEEMSVY